MRKFNKLILLLPTLAFADWRAVEREVEGGVNVIAKFVAGMVTIFLLLFALFIPIFAGVKVYSFQKQKIEQERGDMIFAYIYGVLGGVAGFFIVAFIFFLLNVVGINAVQIISAFFYNVLGVAGGVGR